MFFIGFSLRLNRLVSNKKAREFWQPLYSWFNRTYDGDFGVGLKLYRFYFIPIFKKKIDTSWST
jgi:hypothetical protein